jgi:hypothetical protein
MNDSHKLLILATLTIIALGFAGKSDTEEAERHHSEYCEMTGLYRDSGGDLGWPDYDPSINCE